MRDAANMIQHFLIDIETHGPGLYSLDPTISRHTSALNGDGMMHLFVRHTSCSLTIQENADSDVLRDLQDFFASIAPHAPGRYRHDAEGPDDMPAHIRAALTQTSLSVPVINGRLALGTWQGAYLFEHRDQPHRRQVILSLQLA